MESVLRLAALAGLLSIFSIHEAVSDFLPATCWYEERDFLTGMTYGIARRHPFPEYYSEKLHQGYPGCRVFGHSKSFDEILSNKYFVPCIMTQLCTLLDPIATPDESIRNKVASEFIRCYGDCESTAKVWRDCQKEVFKVEFTSGDIIRAATCNGITPIPTPLEQFQDYIGCVAKNLGNNFLEARSQGMQINRCQARAVGLIVSINYHAVY